MISGALFEGLYRYDPQTGAPVTALARSYSLSKDRMVYSFELREAFWSDGSAIMAQEIVDSWLRFLHPQTPAKNRYLMHEVIENAEGYTQGLVPAAEVGILALGQRTLEVRLKQPAPDFLARLAHPAFAVLPPGLILGGAAQWSLAGSLPNGGPYRLKVSEASGLLSLQKNLNYWDAPRVDLDEIHLIQGLSSRESLEAYRQGEVHWLAEIGAQNHPDLRGLPDYQSYPLGASSYMVFNSRRWPWSDPRVRGALSLALDRQKLLDSMAERGALLSGALLPATSVYHWELPGAEDSPAHQVHGDGTIPHSSSSSERRQLARDLLARAGFPNGEGFPLREILYWPSDLNQAAVESIQAEWRDVLNIRLRLTAAHWADYLDRYNRGQFEIVRGGWRRMYFGDYSLLGEFMAHPFLGHGGFDDPDFQDAVRRAESSSDIVSLESGLSEALSILLEDQHPILPLYWESAEHIIDLERWGGWYPNSLGIHPLRALYRK
jgi:oligopeptide transport system substrate-binding protein